MEWSHSKLHNREKEVVTWSRVPVSPGKPPQSVREINCGSNPCILVGSKVYVLGALGRAGNHGMTIAICDLEELEWEWVEDTSEDAPHLNSHTCFLVDDRVYAVGGICKGRSEKYSSHMFWLDLTLLEWRKIHGYGKQPCERAWHSGGFLEHRRKYVMFGGFSKTRILYNDIWVYCVDTQTWAAPKVKGKWPTDVYGAAACTMGEQVAFFGGLQNRGFYGDLHILDCRYTELNWSTLLLQTKVLRSFASLTYLNGRFIVFGGYAHNSHKNQVLIFEPRTQTIHIAGTKSSKYLLEGEIPVSTYGHTAIKFRGEIYIFDGIGFKFRRLYKLSIWRS